MHGLAVNCYTTLDPLIDGLTNRTALPSMTVLADIRGSKADSLGGDWRGTPGRRSILDVRARYGTMYSRGAGGSAGGNVYKGSPLRC